MSQQPVSQPPGSDAIVMETRGLKRHFGGVAAVNGVDIKVHEGEIYGFLGANGAGKTTTIRLLMGIIAAEAGTITLVGETSRRTTVKQKRRIGYVSQEQTFYQWMSCRALGRFVGSFYPTWEAKEFSRLLELFEIPEKRRVSHLSGGMKAKLALALALTPKPDLLILDEPTAGLDPVARREFMQIIVAQARQHRRTTFFSSHLVDEVERCADRVGIIQSGRMRFEGRLGDLQREVRLLVLPGDAEVNLPPEFELWRQEPLGDHTHLTLRAPSHVWDALEPPAGASVQSLSLEDIFIACVGSRKISV